MVSYTDMNRLPSRIVVVAFALLAASGCSEREIRIPNVVLLVLDTARADHFSAYGYYRPTSPNFEELARKATFYARAIAPAPWTMPTHASIFTGKDPFEHGARTYEDLVNNPVNARALPDSELRLAEALRMEGFKTAAFVANAANLAKKWRFTLGFDTYEIRRGDADGVTPLAKAWLDSTGTQPFFLFLNYMDTHKVYNTTPQPGVVRGEVSRDRKLFDKLSVPVLMQQGYPDEWRQQLIDQYDVAVANADIHVGWIADYLKAIGKYDDTMIIVTADHGEFLCEHALIGHSKDVYEEVAWVPLAIKHPGQSQRKRIDEPTSLTVIPRIILSGMPERIASKYEGSFPNEPGGQPVLCENRFTRGKDMRKPWGNRFRRIRTAVYDWPYKYIHSSDGESELYNLLNDPEELIDLYTAEPERATSMLRMITDYKAQRTEGVSTETPEFSGEELEDLKSLGYIGN